MNDAEGIKLQVSASSLIGRFVKLKALPNRQFEGLCPFHHEKTPSFRVNDNKGLFYCFGCNKGGDIFSFLEQYKGLDFIGATEEIASLYGLKIDLRKTGGDEKIALGLKGLSGKVAGLFHEFLFSKNGDAALEYLTKKRGLVLQTIKKFNLGFCPRDVGFLISRFPDSVEDLIRLGLLSKGERGSLYCAFADRIVFPILDSKGDVVAFAGRIFKEDSGKYAKYLNSKESSIFKKASVIYNYKNAKGSALPPVVMEGYLDVIMMAQYGFDMAVAQMGTAFSEEHMRLLFGIAQKRGGDGAKVLFCYDSDEAGRNAEKRTIELCLPMISPSKTIAFVTLEGAKDADEFLRKFGAQKMREALGGAVPLHGRIWNLWSAGIDLKNPERAAHLEDELMKLCEKISHPALKKHYLSEFRNRIFQAKRGNSAGREGGIVMPGELPEISRRDAILALFLIKNIDFCKSDERMEYFVPFENSKIEALVASFEEGGEVSDAALYGKILDMYGEYILYDDRENFYKRLYIGYLMDCLRREKRVALEGKDFAKLKILNAEEVRLNGLLAEKNLQNYKSGL